MDLSAQFQPLNIQHLDISIQLCQSGFHDLKNQFFFEVL